MPFMGLDLRLRYEIVLIARLQIQHRILITNAMQIVSTLPGKQDRQETKTSLPYNKRKQQVYCTKEPSNELTLHVHMHKLSANFGLQRPNLSPLFQEKEILLVDYLLNCYSLTRIVSCKNFHRSYNLAYRCSDNSACHWLPLANGSHPRFGHCMKAADARRQSEIGSWHISSEHGCIKYWRGHEQFDYRCQKAYASFCQGREGHT